MSVTFKYKYAMKYFLVLKTASVENNYDTKS